MDDLLVVLLSGAAAVSGRASAASINGKAVVVSMRRGVVLFSCGDGRDFLGTADLESDESKPEDQVVKQLSQKRKRVPTWVPEL